MTFYIEGRTKHELMTTNKLFKERKSEKSFEIDSSHRTKQNDINYINKKTTKHETNLYQNIEANIPDIHVIYAKQIMSYPVITLEENELINTALIIFTKHKIRHIPVTSSNNKLQGIISDRDALHFLGEKIKSNNPSNIAVADIMIPEVLTANINTDIRYITRLFIENRIGSIPIMDDRKLVGIITRDDILKAVIKNYKIELWT